MLFIIIVCGFIVAYLAYSGAFGNNADEKGARTSRLIGSTLERLINQRPWYQHGMVINHQCIEQQLSREPTEPHNGLDNTDITYTYSNVLAAVEVKKCRVPNHVQVECLLQCLLDKDHSVDVDDPLDIPSVNLELGAADGSWLPLTSSTFTGGRLLHYNKSAKPILNLRLVCDHPVSLWNTMTCQPRFKVSWLITEIQQ